MVTLAKYYRHPEGNAEVLVDLNMQLGFFIGAAMLVAAVSIWASYVYMHRSLFQTSMLSESHYKTSLQHGYLLVAVAYAVRSIYSCCFQFYSEIIEQRFWKLSLQFLINLMMDLGCIAVVLVINRRTIRLRNRLREIEQRRAAEKAQQEQKELQARIRLARQPMVEEA